MRNLFLLLIIMSSATFSFSQNVAINEDGSDPHPSAMLDVKSSSKGLLVPNMTLAQRSAIASPAQGLLIYQSDGASGFYYNAGTSAIPLWVNIINQNTGWLTGGNAGTNPTVNFIGTKDNQPIIFKANNEVVARLQGGNDANVSLGYWAGLQNTGTNNIAIGARSLLLNSTGNQNTAIGSASMFNNKGGHGNTSIGFNSLYYNNAGVQNSVLGIKALNANTDGNSNTAVGSFSLWKNTTGHLNTSVGSNSLATNTTGIQNTVIGSSADVKVGIINNATAIGANSRVDCDDCLVLGSVSGVNNATSTTRVGIGTTSPTSSAALEVSSNNKGVLVPRMTMMEALGISSPATGLLVYITDNPGGFFYNHGTPSSPDWKNILSNKSGWVPGGNDIINQSSSIGTKNNIPLTLLVNNQQAGFVDSTNTSTSFGYQANHVLGSDNVAIGYQAITDNTEGGSNVAIGTRAQQNNLAGHNNVSVGNNTLQSLRFGAGNTVIGESADVNDENRMNATAIGAYSKVDCDNCLVLGMIHPTDPTLNVRTGIGNSNPHTSAALEVSSTNRGLLIPRMTASQRDSISSPANGLLVYQTDNEQGIYTFNGTSWKAVTPNTNDLLANTWGTNGNAGTDPSLNFIGTIDNNPIVFKTNNELSGYIDPTLKNVLFGRLQDANIQGIMNSVGIGNNALLLNWEGAESLIGIGNNTLKESYGGSYLNIAIGESAGEFNVATNDNIAIGSFAMKENYLGGWNVAIGNQAMKIIRGNENVAIGRSTLLNYQNNNRNTMVGAHADVVLDSLNNATAIGANAKVGCNDCLVLGSTKGIGGNNIPTNNVRVGIGTPTPNNSSALDIASTEKGLLIPRMTQSQRNAIQSPSNGLLIYQTDNTQGFYFYNGTNWAPVTTTQGWGLNGNSGTNSTSNFMGTTDNQALIFKVNNQFAGRLFNNNLSFGVSSLQNSTGSFNTGIGNQSLEWNTSGWSNSALGENALRSNTSGFRNTALGDQALQSNTIGYNNIAIGSAALSENSSGNSNTSVGSFTMQFNSTGASNTTIGYYSLARNISGSGNTSAGLQAMFNNTTGNQNVASGQAALQNNTTGSQNTAIGLTTLLNNITGYNNTAIGAYSNVSTDGLSNATAIGYGAVVDASNKIRLGNSAVTSVESAGTFNTVSDGRFKFNVKEDVKGLRFILNLRPVTYQFDENRMDVRTASFNEGYLVRRTGFIAQEVEQAAKISNYSFNGVIKPQTPKEHYSLSYASFVVPLVKAVQEQQQQIEELKKENDELKKLKEQVEELSKALKILSANQQKQKA